MPVISNSPVEADAEVLQREHMASSMALPSLIGLIANRWKFDIDRVLCKLSEQW